MGPYDRDGHMDFSICFLGTPTMLHITRPLQNAHTGLDMWVPEYQEIRGKMMSGHVEYQIVVVTTLPPFKVAKHKPEDVVQFVVSKKYSEIEEFYLKISLQYPKNSLPSFPRKVLFVGETDIRERRAAFNDIVKAIARDKDLANSPELHDFLGSSSGDFIEPKGVRSFVNLSEDGDFFRDETPSEDALFQIASNIQSKKDKSQKPEAEEEDEEEEEEIDLDPLGIMKTKRIKKKKVPAKKAEDPKTKPKSTMALFRDEVDPYADLFEPSGRASSKKNILASDDIKLFEEQDFGGTVRKGDSLLLPSAYSDDPLFKPSSDEELNDLFRVEKDLEKLLNLGVKPKSKPKPKVPAKPSFLQETKNPDNNLPPVDSQPNVQAMEESDILRYIREHESAGNESLSLF
ncbi:HCLS1-binding protein 3 [Gastrophryne carolinensis]